MVYLTFHKWLVSVCTIHIHMLLWMLQTETSHLWKVRYAIILLGWWYAGSHAGKPGVLWRLHYTLVSLQYAQTCTIRVITRLSILQDKPQKIHAIHNYVHCQRLPQKVCFPDASWGKVDMKNWRIIQIAW